MGSQDSKNLQQLVTLHAQLGRWMLLFSHLPPLYEVQDLCPENGTVHLTRIIPCRHAQTSLPGSLSPVRLIMLHYPQPLEAACTGGPRWRRRGRVQTADADADHVCAVSGEFALPRTLHLSLVQCVQHVTPPHMSPQVQKSPPSLPRWSPKLGNTAGLG